MDEVIQSLEEEKKPFFTPLKIMISIFLVLLIIVMIFPEFNIKFDPEPKLIPKIEDVIPKDVEIIQQAIQPGSYSDFETLIVPNDSIIKQTADKISTLSCGGNKICSAKAMFYFVRDNFDYVNDPVQLEYVKSARESLASGGGDCDDASVLLVNLLKAIGLEARFVFIQDHVYVQVRIKGYHKEGWLNLDPTCKTCDFNELPFQDGRDILAIVG